MAKRAPRPTPASTSTWTRIARDGLTYWFSGVYKIVTYREGEFFAYFIPDHYYNWGDHVSTPPDDGKYSKCWASLESAQAACDAHAAKHTPKPRTVKRAAEIKANLLSNDSTAKEQP